MALNNGKKESPNKKKKPPIKKKGARGILVHRTNSKKTTKSKK